MLRIEDRWSTAEEVLNILNAMHDSSESNDYAEKVIRAHASKFDNDALMKLDQSLISSHIKLQNMLSRLIDEEAGGFRFERLPSIYKKGELEAKSIVRITPIGTTSPVEVSVIATIIGSQVVGFIQINGKKYEMNRASFGVRVSDEELRLVKSDMRKVIFEELIKIL